MYSIHLIFTRHKAIGNCNSDALHKIIASVNPEIIFEELSVTNFKKSYQEEDLLTLETDAIKKYLLDHPIKHIPIDTFDRPKNYDEDMDYLIDRITGSKMISDTRSLCHLLNEQRKNTGKHGFPLLNSRYNDEYIKKYRLLKEAVLTHLNDEHLFQINRLDMEVTEKREDEMLSNIYNYSQKHQYNVAIFFIGSGHRESMLQKIRKCNEVESLKLNWITHHHKTF